MTGIWTWRISFPGSSDKPGLKRRKWFNGGLRRIRLPGVWPILILCITLSAPLPLSSSESNGTDQAVSFNIPAQRADTALIEFAEQADRTLLYSYDLTVRFTAHTLIGQYTVLDGLSRLLEDYSPERLQSAFSYVAIAALITGLLGLIGLESRETAKTTAEERHSLRTVIAETQCWKQCRPGVLWSLRIPRQYASCRRHRGADRL